jgi:S-adenosylmethionine-dependent methyltransferase
MKMTANADSERFQSGADQYAVYLETPEGRLRTALAFANLQDFLHLQAKPSLCALDLGCGTGATAVRLARLGIHVTLLDSSRAMLDIAEREAREAGVTDKVVLQLGDVTQLANLFHARSFDVILCHNILELCDDPSAVLRGAARALRDSSAILSVLVRNQAGEVFKAAIQAGDLAAATNGLTSEWGQESLYGGRVRLFTPDSLRAMLTEASLAAIASEVYASLRTICRHGFPAAQTTNGFLNWSGRWGAGQSMPQSPATHTGWRVRSVRRRRTVRDARCHDCARARAHQ